MHRTLAIIGVVVLAAPMLDTPPADPPPAERDDKRYPSEWFMQQRTWPDPDIRQSSRLEAHAEASALRDAARGSGGVSWQPVGPVNVGGRISDLACHPTDPNTLWIGAASGGVFQTTDGGATWFPLFDDESALSIGSLAVDANDPDVLYVGTGEPNGGGGSVTYGGTGVFRTTNGGTTWTNVGLAETRFIGRVRIDPANSNRVFVAALGSQWSPGPDRGVYRSTNAGGTWSRVLASTDSTGAVDLVIDPSNPNRVYAAMWERSRGPDYLNYGGPTSGIFRSTNGGDTWSELTSGLPTGSIVGRIGLAIAQSSPSTLYAIYADADPGFFLGVYRSTNGGDTWTQTNDGALADAYASFGWWFGNIRVAPANPNLVYVLGLDFYRTTNGGSSWSFAGGSMHVDHHALDFAADGRLFEGNDGGLYTSTTGTTWTHLAELPITQFYTVEVDEQIPSRRYGGTQDNGTIRTLTGADDDWSEILGGDGFRCLVDPTNNSFVYAEFQYGNLYRSTNGGSTFQSASSGLTGRKNWSMPVELDPANPATLYAGTERLHRSTNRGASWTPVSPDLTNGDGGINVVFGTITTIAIAPSDTQTILAGTDDGNVQVTTNGGGTWVNVSGSLPDRWVTRVAFDPSSDAIAYVTVSGFKWDEPFPRVFRTTNFGGTWTAIHGNLPQAPVNDLVVEPGGTGRLFVATDFGVYHTFDGGASWHATGVGLPNVVVSDLEYHSGTETLIAGTYGRSQWTLDVAAATSVEIAAANELPAPDLLPVQPNPSRAGATVRFALPREARVSVSIHDLAGRRVAALGDGTRSRGVHELVWDGRDDSGARVAAGTYFVRLAGDGVTRTRKLTRLD